MSMNTTKTATIKTKTDLAARLQISRNTLDKFLAMDGAPSRTAKGFDLRAVAEFVAENAERIGTASAGSGELKALRAREIGLKCDRLALALARDRAELVEFAAVSNALRRTLPLIPRILDQKLVQEAPTPEEKIRARKAIDEAIAAIQTLAKEFDVL